MEADPKPNNPHVQELVPLQMPYPTQLPVPTHAQVVYPPGYHQAYYPNQVAPPPQPVVYQPAQYVVTATTAPPVVATGLQPHYKDYMCCSVISLFFCCFPLGLAALIFSCKTQDAMARQDLHSAKSDSSTARKLNITAMILGAILYFLAAMFMTMRSHLG